MSVGPFDISERCMIRWSQAQDAKSWRPAGAAGFYWMNRDGLWHLGHGPTPERIC